MKVTKKVRNVGARNQQDQAGDDHQQAQIGSVFFL
jgi:hypothetical protein